MSDNKLRELLLNVREDTIWGKAIHNVLNTRCDLSQLVLELQSQWKDDNEIMLGILGPEACDYIMKPLTKTKLTLTQLSDEKNKGLPIY